MKSSILLMILLQVTLIALNAVFACAEIAVISMNDNRLAKMALEGDKRAIRLSQLTSQPARFLATIQVAITLSGFLGSAFAAENFSDMLVTFLVSLGVNVPIPTLDAISVVFITLVLSYFTLIFGELVPKRVAMRKAEPLALGMSALITTIAKLFAPIVWFLTASTNGILRLLGIDPNGEDDAVSEEEIRMMVDVGSEKGAIDHEEKEFIQNVFEFDDLTAGEIATHRTEVSLLWLEESMDAWAQTIHQNRHSLYPVCDETADNVIGVLNAKDYFRLPEKNRELVLTHCVKPAYFIPEGVKADVLFRNMKKNRNPFAIVLDEYGGMNGILTISDLVEQLVGDLNDDEGTIDLIPNIECIDSTTWKIHGCTPLLDVAHSLGISLPCEDYDTFGGLIFSALGSIPEDGKKFEIELYGLMVNVTNIKDHRIEATMVCLQNPS